MGSLLLSHESAADSSGVHARHTDDRDAQRRGAIASARTLALALAPLALLMVNASARHMLFEALMTVCVVGGFIAAPFLTVAAWIGVILPEHATLHIISTPLFVLALVWLAIAVVSAHLHDSHSRQRD